MYASKLKCKECGWEIEIGNVYSCEECQYSLDVVYKYDKIDKAQFKSALDSYRTFWDFKQLLPVKDVQSIITLHEGNTPLLESIRIGRELGIELYFKDETRNPTASFKDRPNTVGVSMAKEFGQEAVTIASTGNGGSSLATFAAKAGMKCYIFIPEGTPAAKVMQAAVHGATIIKVKGDYSAAYKMAEVAAERYNWANLTSTYLNPYTVEGDKTIAYEICAQLEGYAPNWIVVPLGAGAMLSGIYKGFLEMERFGFVKNPLPRMIGVQAKGCSPITSAFEEGLKTVEAFVNPKTIAGAISDPLTGYPQDGTRTLRAIRESDGAGVSVSDELICACQKELAEEEAIFCEPASATTLSAVYELLDKGIIQKGERVVLIISGHGLKDPGNLGKNIDKRMYFISNIDELSTLFKG